MFGYHDIKLYKSESLGSGSYGGVCKAKCDGLLCAAKIMHPTLYDMCDPGSDSYLYKFKEECHLLSLARHPNVVQYLATYTDPDTRLPVLLMELCDENLTAFLKRSSGPLPYHIQLNICHDIALGLVYLHFNGVIHRDLTGNNILMIAGTRAKITDFGMSKIATTNPHMMSLTLCPGNILYMSPEALDDAKLYTTKLDVFSFGVIAIQIMTRQFPNPTIRFCFVHRDKDNEDSEEDTEIRKVIPESERRKAHLQLIPEICPLKPLSIQCLRKERQRPSALDLSEKLSELKQSSQYKESIQAEQEVQCQTLLAIEGRKHHDQITKLQNTIEAFTAQISAKKRMLKTKDRQISEYLNLTGKKVKELEHTEEKLYTCEMSLKQKDKTIAELQEIISEQEKKIQQLQEHQILFSRLQPSAPKDISKMTWREGKHAPEIMTRGAAVVYGNTAYFTPADLRSVYTFQIIQGEERWSQVPDNPYCNCSLTVINGFVTSVGGGSSNTLLSLTGEGERKQWSEIFPAMSTPRQSATCISTENALLVAGGSNAKRVLDTVEVMSIDYNPTKCTWATVIPLPKKCSLFSGAVCGDTLYMAGGNEELSPSNYVFACPVSDFSIRYTIRSRLRRLSRGNIGWRKICSLPVVESTLVTFRGDLLAIGGKKVDDSEQCTTDIYRYDSEKDSWAVINQINNERSSCFSVTLCTDQLVVVGGYSSQSKSKTVSVEIFE